MRNNVIGLGSPKNSIKAHGDAKLGKAPKKPMERKQARDAKGKTNGTKEPNSNEMGRGCPKE